MSISEFALIIQGIVTIGLLSIGGYVSYRLGQMQERARIRKRLSVLNQQFGEIGHTAVAVITPKEIINRKEIQNKLRRDYFQLWTNVTDIVEKDPVEIGNRIAAIVKEDTNGNAIHG